ncbi:hypothetical protein [Nonomuraea rhodomycinica]|uniref:Uncharacterized protein n=1 Tax=Nonomuraea rhodomycinica TaxID=1712872 RepID=A0A7Y6IQJ3_9ACTN|nr:hypothetical protein [Nonomuraea rhodomycinica]NUW41244.1 hypothetical protein [Nonomuraea rhodomycinica]
MRADDRVSVIRVTKRVGAGRTFPLEAMEEARVTVLPGSLLTSVMSAGDGDGLARGKGRVGLALKPGQAPNELQAGHRVQVIHVPRAGAEQQDADLFAIVDLPGER